MKKCSIFLVFTFLFFKMVLGQPSTFLKTYNTGHSGQAVRELNGNTYVVAGGTDFYYNFHWNIMSPLATTNAHLLKTSGNGNLIWEKVFSSPNHRMISTWMEPVNDGGIILTGHINSEYIWPSDSNDIFLIKTDNNGIISWAKVFDTGKDDLGFSVRQTFDEGFIVSGFHDANPTSLISTTYVILIKTDSNGNVMWERKYQIAVRDLDSSEGLPMIVSQTADSGFVVTGTTVGSHAADVFILRTDQSGNLLWAKSYEHDPTMFRFSLGLDIIESLSGELIVAGSMDKNRLIDQLNYPYILRVNGDGTFLSAKILSTIPDQMFQSGFSSVEQTPDGGYFFTGMGGYSSFGQQAQFLKTNNTFDTQWSRAYTWDGIATMGSRSGRSTTDGCYIFTGKRQNAGTVLMKTDNLGFIPCKTPDDLIELIPNLIVQDRFPSTTSGINSENLILLTTNSLNDTTTLCPVITTSLPVNLTSFSAKCKTETEYELQWKTSSETNNDYFAIERSIDGKLFHEIARIPGAGNSNNENSYRYLDQTPNSSKNYFYRLKQSDQTGEFYFSKTIHAQNFCLNNSFHVLAFPDEDSQTISVIIKNCKQGTLDYVLRDNLGRNLLLGQMNVLNQDFNFIIPTGILAHGVYHFSIISEDKCFSTRVFY